MHRINWNSLSGLQRSLRTPTISFALVLPFMILEAINRRAFHEGFPIVLFGVMWILPLSLILVVRPVVRSRSAGNREPAGPFSLLSRVVLAILIAWLWVLLVRDQMPCFLGVPNCD